MPARRRARAGVGRARRMVLGLSLLSCAAVGPAARDARASVLRLRAPDNCVQASEVADRVETLLGRPLAAVEGVDFEVEIARPVAGKSWEMRLDRIDRGDGGAHGSRRMAGHSCAELADAAAVAIAISIRASDAPTDPTATPRGQAERPVAVDAKPVPAKAALSSPPASPPQVGGAGAGAASAGPSASLTVAAVGDAGALPSAGVGAALELGFDLARWRFVGLGALFASQSARVGSVGGDFDLVFGAVLVCRSQPVVARVVALGCAGAEMGRLAGKGTGVDAPRLGQTMWLAPRAEVGAGVSLSSNLTLVARAGAAAPLSRPEFVADQTVAIHRASRVTARATLGLQIGF